MPASGLQLLCLGRKMQTWQLLMLVMLMTSFVTRCRTGDRKAQQAGLGCEFPIDWRGRYFQSSLGVLTVSQRGITTKGICIERSRDYFLFYNRDSSCYQCLLLLRQHMNIIQYKESYCTSSASALKMVCNEIRVETPLYTLVREPAIPVACPFQDVAYHFDFSDLIHGFCGRPSSSAHSCSLPSRFQMHFSDCIKGTRFQGKDIELECLAIWKDGSETYLYSRLTGSGLVTKDDRYRCFKYQIYGSDVAMAMTADATCRGLRSSVDGPLIMELYKDESVTSQPNCRFPDWLKGVTWRSLSGQYQYRVEADGTAIYRSEQHGPKEKSFSVYRCQSLLENSGSRSEKFTIKSLLVKNCSLFVQCLLLERIAPQVVRFSEGAEQDSVIASCENDRYGDVELLIAAEQKSIACPNPGVHHTTPSGGCIHRLNIGCHDERTIAIDHSCSPGQPGLLFECFASWTEGDKVFVILKKSDSALLDCFTFKHEAGLTIFSSDSNCNKNWSLEQITDPNTLSYSIMRRETCKRNVRVSGVTEKMTTTQAATTGQTTNFVNYYHLEESLTDYSSIDYDFDIRTHSDDETEQRRHHSKHSDDFDDDDDDDDDDGDDKDAIDDLETSSGLEIAGAMGGRRDVFEWYDDRAHTTRKKETLGFGGTSPKTMTTTTTTTTLRRSDLSITGNSFLRETDHPTKFRISLDHASDGSNPKVKDPPLERNTLKSKDASVSHASSTSVHSKSRPSTFPLLVAVVCSTVCLYSSRFDLEKLEGCVL